MTRNIVVLCILAFILVGCASGNSLVDVTPLETTTHAGFFSGIWHGIILPFALIGNLFSDSIGIYSLYNTGFGYNFGYFIGLLILFNSAARL